MTRRTIAVIGFVMISVVSGLSGCAEVVNGATEKVKLIASPDGTVATIDDARSVSTPATVDLSRGDPHKIAFHKEGYQDQSEELTSSESGWVWGNILLGEVGISGAASDEESGAAKKLSKTTVTVTLIPISSPASATVTGSPPVSAANAIAEGFPTSGQGDVSISSPPRSAAQLPSRGEHPEVSQPAIH